jgi:hypothetical protein
MTEDSGLPDRIPRVRRARGYRLYDGSGKRYLDLYQNGGAAILGHRSAGTVREMKDALSRGLACGLPSPSLGRIVKNIRKFFPSYACVRIYSCLHRALEAASFYLGARVSPDEIFDPAVDPHPRYSYPVGLWRPFLPFGEGPLPEVLIPVLPLFGLESFAALCFRSVPDREVPESDHVSPYLLAGTLEALAELSRFQCADEVMKAAVEDAPQWERRGRYLKALFPRSEYPAVFQAFLDAGVLLSPFYPGPSILPTEASAGEARKLRDLFRSHPGG